MKNNIEVDFFGCFWNSNYTEECKKLGYFDFLTDFTLEDVPDEGIDRGMPQR